MKSFKITAAQGEITIRRLAGTERPSGFVAMKPEAGKFIVGHSETGHHHVIAARGADIAVMERPPEGMRILHAILEHATTLEHLRDHDTHEPIVLEPGAYEFRIGREYDPFQELARRQAD